MALVPHFFASLAFWIDDELPNAPQLSRQIKLSSLSLLIQHGRVTPDTTQADYILLHPETKNYARTHSRLGQHRARIVSPHWVEDCALYKRRISPDGPFYSVPIPEPVTNAARATFAVQRKAAKMRIPYTEHDDEMLAYNVAKYHGGRKDMEAIFRRLGKKYPEHSAASWKDHWRKSKKPWTEARAKQIRIERPNVHNEATSSDEGPDLVEIEGTEEVLVPVSAVGYQARKRKADDEYAIEEDSDEEDEETQRPSKTVRADENYVTTPGGVDHFSPATGYGPDSLFNDAPLSFTTFATPFEGQIDPSLMSPAAAPSPVASTSTAHQRHPSSIAHTPASTLSGSTPQFVIEPSDRQVEKHQKEQQSDIVWASCGDYKLAQRYLSATLEEQVEMLDLLWSPEDDLYLFKEEDREALTSWAVRAGKTMKEVEKRKSYMNGHKHRSRLPIGSPRWPFHSEV